MLLSSSRHHAQEPTNRIYRTKSLIMPSFSQFPMLFLGIRVNPGSAAPQTFHRASFPLIHKSNAYVQFKVDETKLCNLMKRIAR
jgi:hypothetical protein